MDRSRCLACFLYLAFALTICGCGKTESVASQTQRLDTLPRNGANQPILPETGMVAPGAPTQRP